MATNFLRLFKAGSARLALVVGASGVGCGASEGSVWIELGGRGKLFCSSTASLVSYMGIASFFSHG